MGDRLRGKVALITGAARGQGEAEARLFAREGARLALGDVLEASLQAVATDLRGQGYELLAERLDVSSEREWAAFIAEIERGFGRLDVLINNAAIMGNAGVLDTSLEEWNRVVAVNQTGVWLGMKHAIPLMIRSGGGSIVNISSVYGLIGSGIAAAYTGTKGAVRLLTKTAAVEHARDGIRVNSIHPGVIDTAMSGEESAEEIRDTPMKRIGQPEEVAYGALFLACDESSFVTGAELVIDGGYTAR
jgi:NAD(P)-dependent dehydrogenase (short-subunit alcohol dehydrogenase family)